MIGGVNDRERRERMCTGKRRYRDEIAAMLALGRIGDRGRDRGASPVRQYRCPYCHGWHLTSQSSRRAS
jgi:hypothetical protein